MLEELFLTYANNPIKENPENLHIIFEEIYPRIEFGPHRALTKDLIKYIVEFSRLNDPTSAKKRKEEIRRKMKRDQKQIVDTAFEAIFMYRDGYCEKNHSRKCHVNMKKLLDKFNFSPDERLKCHECRQYDFIRLLDDNVIHQREELIIEIRSINESQEIDDKVQFSLPRDWKIVSALRKTYDCITPVIDISNDGHFIKRNNFNIQKLIGPNLEKKIADRFSDFVRSVVEYSLAEYLINESRIKLKRCSMCQVFFIATKANRKQKKCPDCSIKNTMSKEEWSQYKKRNNKIKKNRKREELIKRYMNNLHIPRKEAIDLIKSDKET